MNILRTPEERFSGLPDWSPAPHYRDDLAGFEGLRWHYADLGAATAEEVVLCLHGQPTWGYLFRTMAPVFVRTGARVVIPDLFGFGRSDKPVDEAFYTFTQHRASLLAFVRALDLRNITLVVQDWGGLLGLTLPPDMPERFRRLIVMNTTLGTGDAPLSQGFLDWRAWAATQPDMNVGKLMGRTCPHLTEPERAAYDAPFPDARYKAGVRRFPNLVPDRPEADGAALSRAARDWWSREWSGQTFMAIGMRDPVLGPPVMHALRASIRGCPAPYEHAAAGHFVQEWGEPIARRACSSWPT